MANKPLQKPEYENVPATTDNRSVSLAPQAISSPAIAREVAIIQGGILMAKQFPRDEQAALKKIESDCSRLTLAQSAIYTYARGGTNITGPSIRLAEAISRSWGNFRYGFEELEQRNGESVVRAYAYDVETNTQAERTFKVPHIRETKSGRKELTDPRDIYETVANQASRRVRACILECIPGDIVDYAVGLCAETIRKNVKITAKTPELLENAFSRFSINRPQLETFIQRKLEAITADQYIRLQGIFQSLKDGVAKPDDFFDLTVQEPKAQAPLQTPSGKQKPLKKPDTPPTPPEPEPVQETADDEEGPEAFEDDEFADQFGL